MDVFNRAIYILLLTFLFAITPVYAQDKIEWQAYIQTGLLFVLIIILIFLFIRQSRKLRESDNEKQIQLESENKKLYDEQISLSAEKTEIERHRDKLNTQLEEKQRLINELGKKVTYYENRIINYRSFAGLNSLFKE